jgi:predicted dehydrogenase
MTRQGVMRVGLIGAGGVVSTLHAPLLKQFDDVSVEWVYDLRIEAARGVANAYGVPAAHDDLDRCPDVDAVLLAIPVGVRGDVWRAAADRGWHVLCEKPVARTVQEFDLILQSMQTTGRVVSFGLMRRFYHGTICLRQLVVDKVFGNPVEIWAGEGGVQPRTGRGGDWYQLDRRLSGGGILIETGSHLIDQVMFVSGASTYLVEDYAQKTWGNDLEFEARVYGRLGEAAEAHVPFSCVVTRSSDVCNGLFVRYPKITLVLPPGPGSDVELRDCDDRPVGRLRGSNQGALTSFQAFRDEWVAFLQLCRGTGPAQPVADNRLARLSVGVIDDCYARASSDALVRPSVQGSAS